MFKGGFRDETKGRPTSPFSLKFCIFFYEILRKIKSIYMAGKWANVSATPF